MDEQRAWLQFYDPGVPTRIDFEDVPLTHFLERSAADYGDADAILFMNRRLTYRQLEDQVDRFATALAALGVQKDTKVAIQLPNLPQTVIAFYATLSLGAQVVMTNPLYVEREIAHQWHDAGCSLAVVADFLFENRIRAIRNKLPVKNYVIASIPEYLKFPLNLLAPLKLKRAHPPLMGRVAPGDGIHFMKKIIDATSPRSPKIDYSMDDVAALQYTGGTTGVPKGAMLTHRNLSFNAQQIRAWFTGLEPGKEVWLSSLPFFHVFGLTVSMNLPVLAAAAMVVMPNPRDIPGLIRSIAKHRVTVFPAVPAQFNAINNYPGVESTDLSSVKVCVSGSAPLPADVLTKFEERTGGKIVEGFGLTEASPVTHVTPLLGRRKIGCIGLPLPATDAKVVDLEHGNTEVPLGEDGELIVRGPQVMKGYWNQPDETAEAVRQGWLYTGDIARVDDDGFFFIAGRKKEMIIAGGYNIYPDEVDAVLAAHPAVLEAATVGVPDERRGETVKSFVVLKKGRTATAEELIAYCRTELAAYKIPRQVEFRDELPKSAVGKYLRHVLQESRDQ